MNKHPLDLDHARRRRAALAPAACVLALLAAGLPASAAEVEDVALIQAREEIPEEQLLDVGIQVLDPGLPEDDDVLFELEEEKGIFQDVRKAEARYIPVRLMDTLQTTGYWGAVRVVPAGMDSVDVAVSGSIVESNGRRMILELRAADATGRVWFEKRYKQLADSRAYRDRDDGIVRLPFQNIYNTIANDLLKRRGKLDAAEITGIRAVSELKFAADVVPAAFGDYLDTNRKGQAEVVRLPARDDPMMERVARVRERDYLFIDTLTEHYTGFYARMDESYANWRKFSYEEIRARQKAKRQARTRKILGAMAILGGVVAKSDGDRSSSSIGDAAIIGGMMAVQSGSAKGREAKMHMEALRELASSFDAEVEPLLVEVEGQTLRLTGTAEAQYATWRKLLRQIFAAETGLPVDPDTGEQISIEAPAAKGGEMSTQEPAPSREN